jgi:hypothetical protein
MQLTLLHCAQRELIAGQPIRETYLHDRLPYTVKLMAINRAKIPWHVAAVWQADRQFEQYLKRQKHSSRFCPICQGEEVPF